MVGERGALSMRGAHCTVCRRHRYRVDFCYQDTVSVSVLICTHTCMYVMYVCLCKKKKINNATSMCAKTYR